jgi:hypothetical protein
MLDAEECYWYSGTPVSNFLLAKGKKERKGNKGKEEMACF